MDTTWRKAVCLYFCVVSAANLFRSVLHVRVKSGAELSTDHQLVVYDFVLKIQHGLRYANLQDQDVLPNKVGGPGGQR